MTLAERLIEEIPIWAILGGNLLAAVIMLGILFRRATTACRAKS
jgi:hypothetical protein